MDMGMMGMNQPENDNEDSQRLDDLEARVSALEAKLGVNQAQRPAMPQMGRPAMGKPKPGADAFFGG